MSFEKKEVKSVHYDAFKASLPKDALAGKTVIITGTTSGTGKVAAHTVAELGAKVLLLNRNSERSERALSELKAAFPQADIQAVECDLQSFPSVRAAAQAVRKACPEGAHVLCNNAGVMALKDEATAEGFDVQMQTNHLSHFLLTKELMPLLEKAAADNGEARVVNHSSIARKSVKKMEAKYFEKNGGNLGGNGASMMFGGGRWVRYGQTKLANAAFTAALHHRLTKKGSKVKALVAHPGLSNTNLQVTTVKDGGMANNIFTSLFMGLGQSEADGALGILHCMCDPKAQSGEFWGPGKGLMAMKGPAKSFALEKSYDNEKTRELLWQKSCEAIGEDWDL